MDPQASVYIDGARALGPDIQGIIDDVVRKTDVKPKLATPTDTRKYTKAGALYANQRETDEAIEECEERVTADVLNDIEASFQRVDVVRLQSELEEARKD